MFLAEIDRLLSTHYRPWRWRMVSLVVFACLQAGAVVLRPGRMVLAVVIAIQGAAVMDAIGDMMDRQRVFHRADAGDSSVL